MVNGKAGISPESDKAFGGTADPWVALHGAYDLPQARKAAAHIDVKRYVARHRPRAPRSA